MSSAEFPTGPKSSSQELPGSQVSSASQQPDSHRDAKPDAQSPNPKTLTRKDGASIAYHKISSDKSGSAQPGVVFLGGFMSDMTGSKALTLEEHCRGRGLDFLRFDYLGHGQSSGNFADGTIGRWAEDAVAVLDDLTDGPQILVGSSMGGWIMLLAALARREQIAGLIGIAAAPDFTEDLMWAEFTQEQRDQVLSTGRFEQPSEYGDDPYIITRALIEDGREHLLLRAPLPIRCPVRLLQGMRDDDVPWKTALRLTDALESEDVEVTLVKKGDHRLSEPEDLARLMRVLDELVAEVG
ncbi:alpha/beta hydrolase [Denitrobaculum tricleocarpae]|uniref:Palmitoyl-protein thioesterase ABHD10, mitochondrial n=2 Tax=Denitrobaculum tricleocarpae TaxID=2591009 RepID=A0A545U153_9PROT|nr:alpha/beta hydrolase [Denitrobaculum tricleocarpae]